MYSINLKSRVLLVNVTGQITSLYTSTLLFVGLANYLRRFFLGLIVFFLSSFRTSCVSFSEPTTKASHHITINKKREC